MGADTSDNTSIPLNDPLNIKPPDSLAKRQATVYVHDRATILNTIRMPNDPKHPEKGRWFVTGPQGLFWANGKDTGNPMEPVHEGNEAYYMIDGNDRPGENMQDGSHTERAFKWMQDAIKKTGAGDFIYLLNWWYSDDFPVEGQNMKDTLQAASDNGVEIRAMFWQQKGFNVQTILKYLAPIMATMVALTLIPFVGEALDILIAAAVLAALVAALALNDIKTQNQKGVDDINALTNGAAIMDDDTLNFGSHHQKILIIQNKDGLHGFCGGIDYNPDRVDATGHGAPLHDVQVRLKGPAATDVLKTFVERWKNHPKVAHLPAAKQGVKGDATLNATQPTSGEQMVQIGRTFGNGSNHDGIDEGHYAYAPQGERTGSMIIAHAIQSAKRFIYIEDQYFTNSDLGDMLVNALPNVEHITILLTHGSIDDQPDGRFHRHAILEKLQNAGKEKVRVYCRASLMTDDLQTWLADKKKDKVTQESIVQRNGQTFVASVPHTYIHAKLVIVDDRFASIGSINCNKRGWTYDTEITAGVFDESHDDKMALHFAHRLRIKVWAEHLMMDTPDGHAELWDGVASCVHWDRLPPMSHVIRYNKKDNTQPAGASNIPDDYKLDDRHYRLPGIGRVPIIGAGLDAALVNTNFFFKTFIDPDGS